MRIEPETTRFRSDRMPPPGTLVRVLYQSREGRRVAATPCRWTEDGWVDAKTRRRMGFAVVGWRPHQA